MFLFEFIDAIYEFVETGGIVLQYIGGLILVMWLLILERIMYVNFAHKKLMKDTISNWKSRSDKSSWNAEQIRQAMISRISIPLNSTLPVIGALVALCPLLGLMGTVTGMIEVFDVMAISGSGNARSMASGVSKATIPTLAGMVGALSGVFASTWLGRKSRRERVRIEQALVLDH